MVKVFEMFAGYGGATFALEKANIPHHVVGYSEINKYAINCYEQNHRKGERQLGKYTIPTIRTFKNFGDATEINPDDLPDFDLLTGGFPCQTFSLAGKRKGFEDMRGTLIFDIIRIAKAKKPKHMVLENVKGLLSHDNGRTWETIRWALRECGYDILYKVINSRDFGIPHNRERIWIVCKLGAWEFMEFQFPTKGDKSFSLKDLLEDEVKETYYLTEKNTDSMMRALKKREKDLKNNLGLTKGHANCITCHEPKRALHDTTIIQDQERMRVLTEKESFRLMGFVDDEIFLEGISKSQKYKLAGNGWEITVPSKIFSNLYK